MFFGEYEKIRFLGQGSFGIVHLVRHHELGYIRALKESLVEIRDEKDKNWLKFLKECQMLLKIGNGGHSNIVKIYRPRLVDHKAIVEMDYVDGETLREYIERIRFLQFNDIKKFIHDIVGAMAYCHVDVYKYMYNPQIHGTDGVENDREDGTKYVFSAEKEKELIEQLGVCHNDLHSGNIMRKNLDGSFVLLDFGLAKQNNFNVNSSNKRHGAIEYSAPEKYDQDPTIQSDVYSIGVLLFEVLTGTVPFKLHNKNSGKEISEKEISDFWTAKRETPDIFDLRKEAFESLHLGQQYIRDYPEDLDFIVHKCLEIKPENRYKNAKELLNALERAIDSFNPIKNLEDTNVKLSDQLDLAYKQINEIEEREIKIQTTLNEERKKYNDLQRDTARRVNYWKKCAIIFPVVSGIVLFATAFIIGENISPSIICNTSHSNGVLLTDTVFSKDGNTQIIRETVRDTVIINHRDTVKIEVPRTITSTQTKVEYRTSPEIQNELKRLKAENSKNTAEVNRLKSQIKEKDRHIKALKDELFK